MFDADYLRDMQLIEEREVYENEFIREEDIIKSDEMDYYNCPLYEEYISGTFETEKYSFKEYVSATFEIQQPPYEEELDLEFDFEDYFIRLRDEQLIEERLAYESKFFEIPEDIVEYDVLDDQIESYEEDLFGLDYYDYYVSGEPCPDFYDCYEDDYYVEEINMDAAYCGDRLYSYVVDDSEGFCEYDYPEGSEDTFCEYDYPEGPDENLWGFKYPEPEWYSDPCMDFPDDFYGYPEPDFDIEYFACMDLKNKEESYMQELIKEHIAEEKKFLEFISSQDIPDEYLPPEVMDDAIIIIN